MLAEFLKSLVNDEYSVGAIFLFVMQRLMKNEKTKIEDLEKTVTKLESIVETQRTQLNDMNLRLSLLENRQT